MKDPKSIIKPKSGGGKLGMGAKCGGGIAGDVWAGKGGGTKATGKPKTSA